MINKKIKMKKYIKIILSVIAFSLIFWMSYSFADLQNDIIPTWKTITTIWQSWGEWLWVVSKVLNYVKESIFSLLWIIAIWMFIYTGFNLVKAQWNPEEMSKTWQTLIHVIVWLFIVAVSWALVAMVAGIQI